MKETDKELKSKMRNAMELKKKTQNIVIEMRNRNGLWRTVSQTMK